MSHDLLQAIAIFAAGLAAGTINAVVGSGTLITFPTLLALGYPPVLANVSNNVGLVPGVASGCTGTGPSWPGSDSGSSGSGPPRCAADWLALRSCCSYCLAGAFKAIVPVLIGIALVMVVFQPRLARWVAARQRTRSAPLAPPTGLPAGDSAALQVGGPTLWVLVFASGVYGGYFGAAQGCC